jgi:hypothetical protein
VELPNLRGAVADARDLEATLKKASVQDLTLFINRDATRRAIEDAMGQLIARTRIGDLVIVAFAGHGAQQAERVKGSEPDGMDEIFVLSNFRRAGPGTAERILDNEINSWLKQLNERGATVLFIADACHGGGMTRDPDLRAGEVLSFRSAGEISLVGPDELTPLSTDKDALIEKTDLPRVTFLAAADKQTKSPEVRIPGQPTLRGALSYALGRAFEGAADRNGDGKVTRRELFEYSRQVVYQYVEMRQAILTEPVGETKLDDVVFRFPGSAIAQGPAAPGASTSQAAAVDSCRPFEPPPIRLRIVNGRADLLVGIPSSQMPYRVVGKDDAADLVWDVGRREIVSALGDVIVRDVEARDVPGIVDRTAAIMTITKIAETRPQTIVLKPNDKSHRKGERLSIRAEATTGRFVIAFNIAGDGTVQYFFPRDGEEPRSKGVFELSGIEVAAPFGADFVVAIVSDARLEDIEAAIRRLDGTDNKRRMAGRLPTILKSIACADRTVRVGMAGVFTVP